MGHMNGNHKLRGFALVHPIETIDKHTPLGQMLWLYLTKYSNERWTYVTHHI